MMKGVNPSFLAATRVESAEAAANKPKPPPPRQSNAANTMKKPSPPPRPAPNQSPATSMIMGTKPPPGPPPKTGGMRIRASKYAVVESTAQDGTRNLLHELAIRTNQCTTSEKKVFRIDRRERGWNI